MTVDTELDARAASLLRTSADRIRRDGGRLWVQRQFHSAMGDPSDLANVRACAVGTLNIASGLLSFLANGQVIYRPLDGQGESPASRARTRAIDAAVALLPGSMTQVVSTHSALIHFNDCVARKPEDVALLFEQAAEKLEANL